MVEFFEMNCFIFVLDRDVGVALDFGFNIGDIVCLTFTNLLLVVAEVAAVVLAVVIIVFIVANTVLFTAAALVVTSVSVVAVVVGVGTIVEVLN